MQLTRNVFSSPSPLSKSERSVIDNDQAMGKACINTFERVLASKTGIPCEVSFDSQQDLHQAGVLLTLPALLSNGLLKYEKDFYPDKGYYSIASIFLSLSFLALLRIKTLSQSTTIPSGELGKAMGLDRIPEVKTLRERISLFCQKADIEQWGQNLSKDWMQDYPEHSGVLYIDGHVKIYYGTQTQMPKRYVSRLRLCMSGSTDYWINDKFGQPFFVVNKVINSGMIETIKTEILPRLDSDVPAQPAKYELESNPLLCRYMIVFDRECYSPDFFHDLWNERIAVCTYNKNVNDLWAEEEFSSYTEILSTGEKQQIQLAERGVLLQNKGSNKKIWAREIRKKSDSGHQTSILTTNYLLSILMIGVYMFARWSQENFFKYMMENFGIDTLVSYVKEKLSDTSLLINPAYRELDGMQKKLTSKLNLRKVKFATMVLDETTIEEKNMKLYFQKKAKLNSEVKALEEDIEQIKQKKKKVPRKIMYSQLPDNEKFDSAINQRKHFLDTIKMIAYRAETAMANIIKPEMAHADETRTLLKQVYKTDANIFPDYENKILFVELHRMTYWKDDKIVQYLCDVLNDTKTIFPGTSFTLFYKLVSS
ncbi:MAG: putative transposase [Patescibacteria group bacterium]